MEIKVSLPSLLSDCTNGQLKFTLQAVTLQEVVHCLLETYPLLQTHLYDEENNLRKHVFICYNNENIAWLETLDISLQQGDELIIYQAVSGG